MDKIYADPNLENDNTEHIRGKRLSSILKAPRNPLDDLGNGNELTQDLNIEKRKKNSRRVSFANTINCRVFQRDLKNNTTERENTECAADRRNDVLLNQNEEPEAVPCEITGMNTLLHAPIQALVQQTEWHDTDNAIQRTDRHDTTLIFSDENEMDMTASHTAVITRNLKNHQADKTEKIDITSFLAGLNSTNGKAEMSKEFHFFPDPTNHSCPSFEQKEDATTVKKIDFNEFLMSLKSNEKALNPVEGPEKENVFFGPSQVSEDMAQSSVEFVYSHEPLDTCNVTKVFRGQEDGMEMTKCQASDVKAMFSGIWSISSETVFRGDKTVIFSKCDDMEITDNYTDVIYNDSTKEMNNCQNSERQEKTHTMKAVTKVLPTRVDSERDLSIGKTVYSEEDLKCPHSVDGLHVTGAGEPLLARTSEPPEGSSQLPLFSEKSVVFPSGENMDLTGNCTVMVPDYNISAVLSERKAVPGYLDQDENKIMPLKGVMMTRNSQDQPVCCSKTIIFTSAEEMEITATPTAVLSGEMDVQVRESIPAISAAPADKTIVFTHNQDDMEITASHTTALNNNINGFENQELSHKSTQQPDLHSALLSSCREEGDTPRTKDLNGEYHTKSEDKPSLPSASSASESPNEQGAIKVPSSTPPDSVYSVSLPEETVDVWAPQDLDLPMDNSVPVNSQQDLIPPENLKSNGESFKLPSNGPMGHSEESGDLVPCVSLPIQQSDSLEGSPDACSTQRNQVLKGDSSRHEDLATDLGLAGAGLVPVSNKESKENEGLSAEGETHPKHFQINSEQTKPPLVSPRDHIGPTLAPELSGILNVCSKLKNMRRKSTVLSVSETAFPDELPRPSTQSEDSLRLGKDTVNEPNNLFYTKEQENTCLESGAAPIDANLGVALKDKYQGINVPLGIFRPKLPNRRNPSVSSVQDINAKSLDKGEAPVSEVTVNAGETPGNNRPSRQNFSPSQFIAEEFLPVCLEEMDSNESVSSELMENACHEISKKQISHTEKNQFEETRTCNTKRALEQDEEGLQSPKKVKRDGNLGGEASRDLQVTFGAVCQSQVEVHEGEDPPNLSAKSPDCTHASTSSSLDSVKADTELTIQRSSQMESQLLTDSICEDNLREKFQNGAITVGEFFTLLQVHVPIQKPRHSHLPATCAASAPPTPEDLMYSQYIYRPKLRIYEEDCQALSQMIEELKPYANVQDQLLVNVNKSLWEVMRTCSDEELKNFGAELNKMKSYFTKESKILAHNEKVTLYSKLLQSAQEQHGKLQSQMEEMDELLKEAESCLVALEADSDWEESEADCSDEMAEGKNLEEELESLKAQEEALQRELSDLEAQNEQMLVQMNQLKEEEKSCQELVEKYDFTEWEITEWREQQAVFNFLYDSIELTVVFGPPIDGDVFGEDPSRKIVSLNFESLLDEEKAPPSSCLVQRLIFQFIESQGCWQEKCPTLYYLPQVLHDVSLVVSRCRILGEEIEFLERWGGKFNLLKTAISDTRVKLLFSASTVFAKFEVTLSLSANYPSASLPFTVQNQIGNIGEEEVSAVLSSVPVGYHYLRRIVSLIHQNLLQDPR
ncbi:unnamed protein product [Bubo scandiacus]